MSFSALLIMGALVFRQQVLEAVHNLSASLTNVTNVASAEELMIHLPAWQPPPPPPPLPNAASSRFACADACFHPVALTMVTAHVSSRATARSVAAWDVERKKLSRSSPTDRPSAARSTASF